MVETHRKCLFSFIIIIIKLLLDVAKSQFSKNSQKGKKNFLEVSFP